MTRRDCTNTNDNDINNNIDNDINNNIYTNNCFAAIPPPSAASRITRRDCGTRGTVNDDDDDDEAPLKSTPRPLLRQQGSRAFGIGTASQRNPTRL